MIEILLLSLVTGLLAGFIAIAKGRSVFGWFLIGFLFSILGLIAAAAMPSKKPVEVTVKQGAGTIACHNCDGPRPADSRKCPHCGAPKYDPAKHRRKCPACGELVRLEARKCRHCGTDLPPKAGDATVHKAA